MLKKIEFFVAFLAVWLLLGGLFTAFKYLDKTVLHSVNNQTNTGGIVNFNELRQFVEGWQKDNSKYASDFCVQFATGRYIHNSYPIGADISSSMAKEFGACSAVVVPFKHEVEEVDMTFRKVISNRSGFDVYLTFIFKTDELIWVDYGGRESFVEIKSTKS